MFHNIIDACGEPKEACVAVAPSISLLSPSEGSPREGMRERERERDLYGRSGAPSLPPSLAPSGVLRLLEKRGRGVGGERKKLEGERRELNPTLLSAERASKRGREKETAEAASSYLSGEREEERWRPESVRPSVSPTSVFFH